MLFANGIIFLVFVTYHNNYLGAASAIENLTENRENLKVDKGNNNPNVKTERSKAKLSKDLVSE